MPLSLKSKQVAGVTILVTVVATLLVGWFLTTLAGVMLHESRLRAELVVSTIFQRTFDVVAAGGDPVDQLRTDAGLRSILRASIFAEGVTYAAVVSSDGVIIAHADPAAAGQMPDDVDPLDDLIDRGPIGRLTRLYAQGGRTVEVRQPLLLDDGSEFGSIRVGMSTLLIRTQFEEVLTTPLITTALALVGAVLVALLLANLIVRPIHVIGSSLARLGRGEIGGPVDLPDGEFAGLGESVKAVMARMSADQSALAGSRATLESVVGSLADGVAWCAPDGTLLFANPVMRPLMGVSGDATEVDLPDDHPCRAVVSHALAGTEPDEPITVSDASGDERVVTGQVVRTDDGDAVGVILTARNLAYLSEVESTLNYSRKIAALSRLTAGIAHEIKNPLNATMIHLELLKQQVADTPDAREHAAVIASQLKRLDEVVQGFLKFSRPEDLRLQPVALASLFDDLMPIIRAEASKSAVEVERDIPGDLPAVAGDRRLLDQAFLNLVLNACQAMPTGGLLRLRARTEGPRIVMVRIEDTGGGIPPEQLSRIFDLYFTTKAEGSGIGLSLVYRTVQLHDGEIEVESTPGRGTVFKIRLPRAQVSPPTLPISAS